MRLITLVTTLIALFVSPAWAELRTITATGEYRMGDNDTRMDAKRLALQDAKRLALEKAGTYLESITEVKNFQLGRDEIWAYTAGIVEVLEQEARSTMEGQQQILRVDVTCKIDTDVVTRQIDALRKNETAKTVLLQAKQEADRLRQKLEAKTRELASSKSKTEVDTMAQARREVLTNQDINSLLAQAWATLAGGGDALLAGSSSKETRVHTRHLLEQALALDPNDHYVHQLMGILLREEGNLDGAIAEFRTALRLKPDGEDIHTNLGNALKAKGDLDGAVAAYREALRLKPDYYLTLSNLGIALKAKGDLDGAVAAYREALRINSSYLPAHYNLGIALKAKGDLDGAIAAYREALIIAPDNADTHTNLGNALRAKGDRGSAIVECREALRLNPDHANAHASLGDALKDKGQRKEAAQEFREYLRLIPDTPANQKNIEKAKALLRELE